MALRGRGARDGQAGPAAGAIASRPTEGAEPGALAGRERAFAVSLVLGGVVSTQTGAAVATTLFDELGPTGTVLLRVGFAALVLLALWRPTARGLSGLQRRYVVLFGIAVAGMNWSFYGAIDRIPLGIAVTIEFIGPLGVAIALSRRWVDLVWVGLAAAGILLLSPIGVGEVDPLGAGLALLAGAFWAAYILLAARVGRAFTGGGGLALAMAVGAVVLVPAGIVGGGAELANPGVLAVGLGVALLSSAIPYSLEMEALRRIRRGTFGVLMSLEPAVAAIIGFLLLAQGLAAPEVLAIALVVAASAGALREAPPAAEA